MREEVGYGDAYASNKKLLNSYLTILPSKEECFWFLAKLGQRELNMIWSRYNQLDDNLKETGSDNRISENLDVEKTIAFRTVYQKEY